MATLICLFVFGFFKSKATGVPPFMGAVRVTLIGAMAAAERRAETLSVDEWIALAKALS